ncbi:hypothetical protein KHP62_16205 [Rhodobacteraceae bacterium NNCM2]|nr:hypothetical protein [Coraliihabitans acroporae]
MFKTILPPYLCALLTAGLYGYTTGNVLISVVIGLVLAAPLTLVYATLAMQQAEQQEANE